MQLTSVRFEAFKSLYDVECPLDRFTVITGPNGAGKSNFVDALNFLGEVYADGLEFAVGRAGGYENIAHRRTRRAKKPIAMTVEAILDGKEIQEMTRRYHRPRNGGEVPDNFAITYTHRFALGTTTQSLLADFQVREDQIDLHDLQRRQLLRMWRSTDASVKASVSKNRVNQYPWLSILLDPFTEPDFIRFINRRPSSPANLLTDEILYYGAIFSHIRSALGGTRIFQLSPYQCRTSGVPTPNAVLERHGENLPGAADHLRRNAPRSWAQVQNAMRTILPDLESIDVVYTEDRRLALQFRDRSVGRPWNTGEVSDGTIQSLALFIALYDTRYPLLVIEEPENAVHPWILRQFLDQCMDTFKQIIVTTHSPVVLNYVDPQVVRLMSIHNGRSHLQRLLDVSEDLAHVVLNGDVSMFDAYDSGMVRAALPRGYVEDQGSDD